MPLRVRKSTEDRQFEGDYYQHHISRFSAFLACACIMIGVQKRRSG